MPIGVERPRNVGKKSIGGGSCGGNTFFIAVACALAGTSGTERGDTLHELHKSFIEARVRWRVSDVRLFYIMCLCNPQLKNFRPLRRRGACIRSHYVI